MNASKPNDKKPGNDGTIGWLQDQNSAVENDHYYHDFFEFSRANAPRNRIHHQELLFRNRLYAMLSKDVFFNQALSG